MYKLLEMIVATVQSSQRSWARKRNPWRFVSGLSLSEDLSALTGSLLVRSIIIGLLVSSGLLRSHNQAAASC